MPKETNIDQQYIISQRLKVGLYIKEERERLLMSQETLGSDVGVTAATIEKIETGRYPASIDIYLRAALCLGLTIKLINS